MGRRKGFKRREVVWEVNLRTRDRRIGLGGGMVVRNNPCRLTKRFPGREGELVLDVDGVAYGPDDRVEVVVYRGRGEDDWVFDGYGSAAGLVDFLALWVYRKGRVAVGKFCKGEVFPEHVRGGVIVEDLRRMRQGTGLVGGQVERRVLAARVAYREALLGKHNRGEVESAEAGQVRRVCWEEMCAAEDAWLVEYGVAKEGVLGRRKAGSARGAGEGCG